jgi:diaminopimelate epimerase
MLRFTKMNGAGNDFVLVDNRAGKLNLSVSQIATLCDRHRGIGADGLLALEATRGAAQFRMRYYNSDGGEAEMCGNGARCFARFADRVAGPFSEVTFETPAGLIRAVLDGEHVTVNMSLPRDLRLGNTLRIAGEKLTVHSVNTGVPHAVTFVEDISGTPVLSWGREIRNHPAFQPAGANANFVQVVASDSLLIRTYERGVEGETLACGTGVTAGAIIYASISDHPGPIWLQVRGGDRLQVAFTRKEGQFADVTLSGPATFSFQGETDLV